MLFNSVEFAVFLPIVFAIYWLVGSKNVKSQNVVVVAASCFFYGSWDWRFLILIFISTLTDYMVGRGLAREDKEAKRKVLLWVSILANLGILAFFKYYNFFIESFTQTFSVLGSEIKGDLTLNIILPIGISFYTFQTLSYSIDVYRSKLEPTKDFLSFSAFVSFFPQLVAGPIEKATRLLPQFQSQRTFDYDKAVSGMRQILWGLVKKIVIADNCAEYANLIFSSHADYSGSTLLLGAFFFTIQIYGDFSGYSDIAIGTARLFGIELSQNFNFPFFSRSMAEFWRRWHISLSSWFKDYLYVPMGGSRKGKLKTARNIVLIFIVSGLWHGPNWTFIFWGLLNALLVLPSILNGINRRHLEIVAKGRFLPEAFQVIRTFTLVTIGFVLFRSESLPQSLDYLSTVFSKSLFTIPGLADRDGVLITLTLVFVFFLIEWRGREQAFAIEKLGEKWAKSLRWTAYLSLVLVIFYFGSFEEIDFIYFQF